MRNIHLIMITGILSLLAITACSSPSATVSNPPSTANDQVSPFYEGTAISGNAEDFELIDQNGNPLALSSLRGRAVVLAFLDPHCTDICPLTALHFRQADKALGSNAGNVVFLAVNMNAKAASTADTLAASKKWGVDAMVNWHYLTGSTEELQQVWSDYDVFAGNEKPEKPGEVQHTPGVYIIDQSGEKLWYISTAFDYKLSLSDLLVKRVRELLAS